METVEDAGYSGKNLKRPGIQRTLDALEREQGVRLGRPAVLPSAVERRIARERQAKKFYRAIAEGLNADAIPRAQGGGKWHASTVRSVAQRITAAWPAG